MRIVQLTPGTGSFYCGTCLRDNALVVELRRQGHEALLAPLYLPMMLDEDHASPDSPLFYGGVNVYLQQKSALFRKTPRSVDRLLDAAPVLKLAARQAEMTQAADVGDLMVSTLRGETGRQAKELDRLVEWLADEIQPEVVCLSNALLVGLARQIKAATGAAVVCTLQGEDSYLDAMTEPSRQQSWEALIERCADVDAFLAVSHYYADEMGRRAQLPAERVHVVYNGISLEGYGPAPSPPDPPAIGYLARMCPAKGLHTLVEAYIQLRHRDRVQKLQLRVAGSCTRADEAFVAQLQQRLEEAGLLADAEFRKNVDRDEKITFLQSLSALSVPATYGESFGLYVIEALAAGVPVVQPRSGAFPELIEATGGGLLCEPDDASDLAQKLETLLLDPDRSRAMGAAGRQAVQQRFSVEQMAREAALVFEAAGRQQNELPSNSR